MWLLGFSRKSTQKSEPLGNLGRQSDRVAELLKLSDMMTFQPWCLQLFKIVLTQVLNEKPR